MPAVLLNPGASPRLADIIPLGETEAHWRVQVCCGECGEPAVYVTVPKVSLSISPTTRGLAVQLVNQVIGLVMRSDPDAAAKAKALLGSFVGGGLAAVVPMLPELEAIAIRCPSCRRPVIGVDPL